MYILSSDAGNSTIYHFHMSEQDIYTTATYRIVTKAPSPRGSVVRARSVDFGTSEVEAY